MMALSGLPGSRDWLPGAPCTALTRAGTWCPSYGQDRAWHRRQRPGQRRQDGAGSPPGGQVGYPSTTARANSWLRRALTNPPNGAISWLPSATSAASSRVSATRSRTRTAAPGVAGTPTSRPCTPSSGGRRSGSRCAPRASRPARSSADDPAAPGRPLRPNAGRSARLPTAQPGR